MSFVRSKVQLQITSKQYDKGDSKSVGGFYTWPTKQKHNFFMQDFQSLIPSLDEFYSGRSGTESHEF
jgi:hypothetical protein